MKLPVAEFAPDLPDLDSGSTGYVNNVVPLTAQSYGPFPTVIEVGDAIDARCQGMCSYRGPDGSLVTFAGDATKLYQWDGTAWNDVSRTVGGAYAVATTDMWDFELFGDKVVAFNGTDTPQVFTIGTSTEFEDLAGTPPTSRFVAVVRDFLFTGRKPGAVNTVHWSGINNITTWTPNPNVTQADEQELPEGGKIMGIVGGEYATVFCETAIHRFTYQGTPLVFSRDRVSTERGCAAEGSIAAYQSMIFFLSYDGFYMMAGGGETAIGSQKVDDYFWSTFNKISFERIISTVDPVRKLYVIAFPSVNSFTGTPDKCLIYNWSIGRWAQADIAVDFLSRARTGIAYNLDTVDVLFPGGENTAYVSADSSFFEEGLPLGAMVGFTADFKLAYFVGNAAEATVDSIEGNIVDNRRAFVRTVRPLVDGNTDDDISIALGTRNKINQPVEWTAEVAQNRHGLCGFRSNARYHRARLKVVAGANWQHIQGVEAVVVEAGER